MQKLIEKVSPSGGIFTYFVLGKGRNVIKSKETSFSYVSRKTLIEAREDGFLHPYGTVCTSLLWVACHLISMTIKLQWIRPPLQRQECGGPGDRDPVEGILFWSISVSQKKCIMAYREGSSCANQQVIELWPNLVNRNSNLICPEWKWQGTLRDIKKNLSALF